MLGYMCRNFQANALVSHFQPSTVLSSDMHYENMPTQYTAISNGCKNGNFWMIFFIFFLFLLKTKIVGTRLNE